VAISKSTITDTPGLLRLAKNSSGRNRSVNYKKFEELLDPEGTHVMCFQMIHNDCELRTAWLCKYKEDNEPHRVWLDVSFERFNECVMVTPREL